MKKPIKIPCILILNYEEIQQAESLGFDPPEEIRVLHELTFLNIDIIETPYVKPKGNEINSCTYIYSSGRVFSTTMKENEIESLMKKSGWYD